MLGDFSRVYHAFNPTLNCAIMAASDIGQVSNITDSRFLTVEL